MKTCLLHCSLNSGNSILFFVKNVQHYLIIYFLKHVITLTQSASLSSHQTLTSLFKFFLSLVQLQERNKQLLDEVERELSMPRSEASVDNINTRFYNSLTMIMFCYAFFNQPAKRGITRTTLNSTWYHVKRRQVSKENRGAASVGEYNRVIKVPMIQFLFFSVNI